MANVIEIVLEAKDNASAVIGGIRGQFPAMGRAARVAGAAIATGIGAGLTATIAMARQTATLGDEIQKMSIRTGIGTESLSTLAFAAEQSGADLGTLENGLRRLQRTTSDAAEGLTTATRPFERLGISIRDNNGNLREADSLLPEIADKLNGLATDTERAATAQELFGRSGTMLIPLLEEGSAGIQQLQEDARGLGREFSQNAADDSAAFIDAQNRVKSALQGVRNAISRDLIPLFTDVANKVADWTANNEGLIGTIRTLIRLSTQQGKDEARLGEITQRRVEVQERLAELEDKRETMRRIRERVQLEGELVGLAVEEEQIMSRLVPTVEELEETRRTQAEVTEPAITVELEEQDRIYNRINQSNRDIAVGTEKRKNLLGLVNQIENEHLDNISAKRAALEVANQNRMKDTASKIESFGRKAFGEFARSGKASMTDFRRFAEQELKRLAANAFFKIFARLISGQTSGIFSGLFRNQGGMVSGFQQGVSFVGGRGTGDRVPALLEPGEGVIPRSQMQSLIQRRGGGGGGETHFHFHNMDPQSPAQRVSAARWLDEVQREKNRSF